MIKRVKPVEIEQCKLFRGLAGFNRSKAFQVLVIMLLYGFGQRYQIRKVVSVVQMGDTEQLFSKL